MQGSSKSNKGPLILVHFNGYVEASMQGDSKLKAGADTHTGAL
jgi:hypothetical protein